MQFWNLYIPFSSCSFVWTSMVSEDDCASFIITNKFLYHKILSLPQDYQREERKCIGMRVVGLRSQLCFSYRVTVHPHSPTGNFYCLEFGQRWLLWGVTPPFLSGIGEKQLCYTLLSDNLVTERTKSWKGGSAPPSTSVLPPVPQ